MDCEMVLYGFIGEVSSDAIFDENEVDGLTIRFKERNSDGLESFTIFPKILVDLKKHRFYDLFPQLESIKYSYLGHSGGKKFWREDDPDNKKNYYFFKKFFDTIPEVFSDEVYFVCKYREDGKFKYEIFSPHDPDLSDRWHYTIGCGEYLYKHADAENDDKGDRRDADGGAFRTGIIDPRVNDGT